MKHLCDDILQTLGALALSYDLAEHLPGAVGFPGDQHCKNLLLAPVRRAEGRRFLLVFPFYGPHGHARADMRGLAAQLGTAKLQLLPAEDLQHTLGVEPGWASPLALVHSAASDVHVLLDERFKKCKHLCFYPGTPDHTVRLTLPVLLAYIRHCGNAVTWVDAGRPAPDALWAQSCPAGPEDDALFASSPPTDPAAALALAEAQQAAQRGEVPVGAVVTDANGRVLAAAGNTTRAQNDPTAHAEVLALRRAAAATGDWRLTGCTLTVTLEPCAMCAGAAYNARVSRVVYLARDARAGALGSACNVFAALSGAPEALYEQHEEASKMLRTFFQNRRAETDGETKPACGTGCPTEPPSHEASDAAREDQHAAP